MIAESAEFFNSYCSIGPILNKKYPVNSELDMSGLKGCFSPNNYYQEPSPTPRWK